MTTTTDGTAKLTGISRAEGVCDRCDRDLGTVYGVVYPDGTEATLGRKCCAKATGFRPNAIEREARAAARKALVAERQAEIEAAYPDALPADALTAATEDRLWDGRGTGAYTDWRDYLTTMAGRS